jgi:hypothetical protein
VIVDGSSVEALAEGAPAMSHVPWPFQQQWSHPGMATERAAAAVALALARSGLGQLVWQRYWTGVLLLGIGAGAAALGRPGPWVSAEDPDFGSEVRRER